MKLKYKKPHIKIKKIKVMLFRGRQTTFNGLNSLFNRDAIELADWASSDIRLKKNIRKISDDPVGLLMKINGVKFNWKSDVKVTTGHDVYKPINCNEDIGVMAQEVKKVLPMLIGINSKGDMAVSYNKFTPVLIEAIKQQQKQIDLLKKEIEKLKK